MEKLEKAIKKQGAKSKKRCRDDCNSDSEKGIGSGSMGKTAINLEETVEKTKLTPPSQIKANPTLITSNQNDVCPTIFCNAGDAMMTSSSQNKGTHVNYSTPTNKYASEGKTTAVVAVMRGKPKDGCHHRHSSKHYKQKLVWSPVRQRF